MFASLLIVPLALSTATFASSLARRQSQPAPGCNFANVDEFGLIAQYDSGLQKQLVLTGNGNDSSAVAWLGTRSLLEESDVLGVNFTMTNSGLTSSTSGGIYTPRYDSQVFSNEFLGFESQKGKNESPDNIYCLQPAAGNQTLSLLEVYGSANQFYICNSTTSSKDELVVYAPFSAGNSGFDRNTCQHAQLLIVQGEQ